MTWLSHAYSESQLSLKDVLTYPKKAQPQFLCELMGIAACDLFLHHSMLWIGPACPTPSPGSYTEQ